MPEVQEPNVREPDAEIRLSILRSLRVPQRPIPESGAGEIALPLL